MPSNQRSQTQGGVFSGSQVLGRVNLTGTFVREMASHVRQNKLTAGERDMTARILEAIAGGGSGTSIGATGARPANRPGATAARSR